MQSQPMDQSFHSSTKESEKPSRGKKTERNVIRLYNKEVVRMKLMKILDFINSHELEGSIVRVYSNYFLNKFVFKQLPGVYKRKTIHAELLVLQSETLLLQKIISEFQQDESFKELVQVSWEDYKPTPLMNMLSNEATPRNSEVVPLVMVNILITWCGPCPRTLVPSKEIEDPYDGPFDYFIFPGNKNSSELQLYGAEGCSQIKQIDSKTKNVIVFTHPFERQITTELEEEIRPLLLQQGIQKNESALLKEKEFSEAKRLLCNDFAGIFAQYLREIDFEAQSRRRGGCYGKREKTDLNSTNETNVILDLVKIRTFLYESESPLIERRKLAYYSFSQGRCEIEKKIKELMRALPNGLIDHYEMGTFLDELDKKSRSYCEVCKIF